MELRRRLKDALVVHRGAIFAHRVRGVKVAGAFVPDIVPTSADVDHAERLLVAYNLATADAPAMKSEDLWTSIARQQRSFFEVLKSGDSQQLAAYLCNMSRHDATQGTVQGAAEYRHLRHSAGYRRFVARMAKDKLVSLAEAVGALPCENPEQGVWGHNFQLTSEDLVSRVSAVFGLDVTPPPIDGGLFKISAGSRHDAARFGERDCNAIYTSWALVNLLDKGAGDAAVCEIGGGSGRVAYWARRFGIDDYTIYDLPQVNAVQGFYLMKAMGGEAVRLYGESHAQGRGGICVLPYFACTDVTRRRYDLVLNQDSFPEINTDVVREYLAWIKKVSRAFLSINHESRPNAVGGALQNNVSELVRESGGYCLRSRQLYWLRKGYVMELYQLADGGE
jgi:hypothetical protein